MGVQSRSRSSLDSFGVFAQMRFASASKRSFLFWSADADADPDADPDVTCDKAELGDVAETVACGLDPNHRAIQDSFEARS
jgi:hypothetical protein